VVLAVPHKDSGKVVGSAAVVVHNSSRADSSHCLDQIAGTCFAASADGNPSVVGSLHTASVHCFPCAADPCSADCDSRLDCSGPGCTATVAVQIAETVVASTGDLWMDSRVHGSFVLARERRNFAVVESLGRDHR